MQCRLQLLSCGVRLGVQCHLQSLLWSGTRSAVSFAVAALWSGTWSAVSFAVNTELKVNGQKLEIVTSFKYLVLVITDEGSKPEILSRITQATAALTRLKPVWIDKSISLSSKIRLMCFLVTSIFLYACESWTLTAELQRRNQAMEMRCYCKILHISYKDHVTNEEICTKTQQVIGPHETF